MKADGPKSMLLKIGRDSLVVAPTYIIILTSTGLGIYSATGNQEAALWICGITLGASIVLMPIAYFMLPLTESPTIDKSSETSVVGCVAEQGEQRSES